MVMTESDDKIDSQTQKQQGKMGQNIAGRKTIGKDILISWVI